jgi:hypothetical protein
MDPAKAETASKNRALTLAFLIFISDKLDAVFIVWSKTSFTMLAKHALVFTITSFFCSGGLSFFIRVSPLPSVFMLRNIPAGMICDFWSCPLLPHNLHIPT